MVQQYIVTGIGTDIGKTVVSAILSEALKATYWKPIQAGDLDNSDSIKVNRWTSNNVTVLEEKFRLNSPMSPHAAATIDGISIQINDIQKPELKRNLIIEGAGGIMVPINENGDTYLDVFEELNLPVIIVSRNYLGSINHSLMTIEMIQNRGIEIKGIIFSGPTNEATENIILSKTKTICLARIPEADEINSEFIRDQAKNITLD
jgi:dethiobiotin synthetase